MRGRLAGQLKIQLRVLVLAACTLGGVRVVLAQGHVIEVIADKDSRYRVAGQADPEIRLKAGEPVVLRITSRKAKTWNRDGSVHGFTLLRVKDRSKVPDWNLTLKPGTQEFHLTAPLEAGEYLVVCTVICSEEHENMHMKLVVLP